MLVKGLLALALVAVMAGATWWLADGGLFANPEAVAATVAALGAWGPAAIVALMTVAVVISPLPSAPIALAAGFLYGHGWGTALVVAGAEAGALIAFAIARLVGYEALHRRFGERLGRGLLGSQNTLMVVVLVSRLIPFISFDMVSYAAGLTRLTWPRFALATLIGLLPASFLLAHFGGQMASANAPAIATAALALGALTALPLLLRYFLRRRRRD